MAQVGRFSRVEALPGPLKRDELSIAKTDSAGE